MLIFQIPILVICVKSRKTNKFLRYGLYTQLLATLIIILFIPFYSFIGGYYHITNKNLFYIIFGLFILYSVYSSVIIGLILQIIGLFKKSDLIIL